MVTMISYDLRQPGRNYNDLYEKIKSFGDSCHCLESVWLVKTRISAEQIMKELAAICDENDKIIVLQPSDRNLIWSVSGLEEISNEWLKKL